MRQDDTVAALLHTLTSQHLHPNSQSVAFDAWSPGLAASHSTRGALGSGERWGRGHRPIQTRGICGQA
jgi:hypothetical protein